MINRAERAPAAVTGFAEIEALARSGIQDCSGPNRFPAAQPPPGACGDQIVSWAIAGPDGDSLGYQAGIPTSADSGFVLWRIPPIHRQYVGRVDNPTSPFQLVLHHYFVRRDHPCRAITRICKPE